MKKRKQVGVWLLIIMLVLSQISCPGSMVQANGTTTAQAEVAQEDTSSKTETKEDTIEAKTKNSEKASKTTKDKTETAGQDSSSDKDEKSTADKDKADQKDAKEEEQKDDKDSEKESGEQKDDEDVEKEKSEKKDDEAEAKKDTAETTSEEKKDASSSEEKKDETSTVATTEQTEATTETTKEDGVVAFAKSKSVLTDELKDAEPADEANTTYQVQIQPVDVNDKFISGTTITVEKSTDQSNWTPVNPTDGKHSLSVKENDITCSYRFKVTTEGYYEYNSAVFSLTEDDTRYFNISSLEDNNITITAKMTQIPVKYQGDIKPVDENGNSIPVTYSNIYLEKTTDPTNQNSWKKIPQNGTYEMPVKNAEGKAYYYQFSIKVTDYHSYSSEVFTLIQESAYFSLDSVKDGILTIQPVLEKILSQYRVNIKAVDSETGEKILNSNVTMRWSLDAYSTYTKEAEESGTYLLDIKSGSNWIYYQFDISATGYTSYTGEKFCFQSGGEKYFDVNKVNSSFTIEISMTSAATTLRNAKEKAINELENYKKLSDYRQTEQEKIQETIKKYKNYIENATTVADVNSYLNRAKKVIDALKTKIQYEDEEYRSRIYFLNSDGEKNYVDQYGVVTLTNIEDGNFYITHPDGSLYQNNEWDAKWRCVYEYQDQDHPESIAFNVIIGTYGQYAGKFIGKYDATVTLSDLGRSIKFTVKIIDARIDKLRAYVDGKDVSGKTINVMGSEKKQAVIEGRLKGTTRWISIPAYSLHYEAGSSTSIMPATGVFRTWGSSGSVTYSLDADRSVCVTLYIKATIVHPTSVRVECPSKATVGDWNGALNQYVGIMQGKGEGQYRVVVTPENASNPGVIWKELTPDVATFQGTLHSAGIVPKKAGTAKFEVYCVDNPKANTTVTILFQYEKPLKTAEVEEKIYYAKPSDKTINLNIITNGQKDSSKGASEQRFDWSYSTSGVVKVTDSVHYDKTSVTIPNWFTHTITILGEGTVTVTGIPWDDTENCKPVKFKVVVSSDPDKDKAAAERVEKLILNIGKVTLEKKTEIRYARAEFQALTSTQKGLVDDDIYAKLVAAELELRRLERGDTDEDDGSGGNGGTDAKGDGDGNGTQDGGGGTAGQSGDSGNVETSGGDGTDAFGGGDGTGTGENGTGNDSSMAGDGTQSGTEDAANALENARARRRTNSPAVVQAASTSNNNSSPSSSKKAGAMGIGKKFYEIDIQDIPKEVIKVVENISPEMKFAVTVCVLLAFIYGFMRRRRQHLNEEDNKNDLYS
ncbi:hypothetical protein FYJ25_02920 [Anaerobutyricum soehngenii]|uniref:Uncharacterized protein n=1 Tax=Anaerobutyricum soehngenii TaxID=105843 RepID=A0A6N7YCV8_9FIRM|nr:hypothetical protein [Anaerobutyricum soehngenii]MSU81334.1 hypothetical protein [Anaerobutyricum soehngenii]